MHCSPMTTRVKNGFCGVASGVWQTACGLSGVVCAVVRTAGGLVEVTGGLVEVTGGAVEILLRKDPNAQTGFTMEKDVEVADGPDGFVFVMSEDPFKSEA